MGVLKSRHGAGTFVASGPPALDSSSLTVLGALHGFLPWQMFEARLTIEASVAALAAERATGEHLAELAEEVAEMYASMDDPQEYLIHDVRFHRTIARAIRKPHPRRTDGDHHRQRSTRLAAPPSTTPPT